MIVLTFQPRFAPLVEAGTKRQTIRRTRYNPIKTGDELSLRTWAGKPYRSKQRLLWPNLTPCHVSTIHINQTPHDFIFIIDGKKLSMNEWPAFARADGFDSTTELLDWFRETHGLPFDGTLIKW